MLQACPRQLEGGGGVPGLAPAQSCKLPATAPDIMQHVCGSSFISQSYCKSHDIPKPRLMMCHILLNRFCETHIAVKTHA